MDAISTHSHHKACIDRIVLIAGGGIVLIPGGLDSGIVLIAGGLNSEIVLIAGGLNNGIVCIAGGLNSGILLNIVESL